MKRIRKRERGDEGVGEEGRRANERAPKLKERRGRLEERLL